jgi:hypothetical protein
VATALIVSVDWSATLAGCAAAVIDVTPLGLKIAGWVATGLMASVLLALVGAVLGRFVPL